MEKDKNQSNCDESGKQQPVVDRDEVKKMREANRQAKRAAKQKVQDKSRDLPASNKEQSNEEQSKPSTAKTEKSPTKTTKKKIEVLQPQTGPAETVSKAMENLNINKKSTEPEPSNDDASISKKEKPSKAERRAIQEAQRAAKEAKQAGKAKETKPANEAKPSTSSSSSASKRTSPRKHLTQMHRVKLFDHLYVNSRPSQLKFNDKIHPAIVQLGEQYASGVVKGCNARALAFMNAIKLVIDEYETPEQKEFARSLEDVIKKYGLHLHQCRPLAVSVTNAMKFIQWQIRQLPKSETDDKLKLTLIDAIDTYVREQIDKAAESIRITVQKKISDGDVILTFGCSSVVLNILNEAKKSKRDFRVIVVDARPWHEGREMLRRLAANNIKATCVLINAVGFIMPEVTKVLLGAHALLANGYVMSRVGTAQVALVAKSYNVPVLVCCETHKFSERVQTDAFVYNEIGNPFDLVKTDEESPASLANWQSVPHLTPLNLLYDVTPPELVSAVVTEVAILPCTSVPVILREQILWS